MAHNVRAVIFNSEGKFLLVTEVDDPDNFKLPGGKIDGGEDPESAIERELFEELNLKKETYDLSLAATLKTENEGDNRYIFRIKLKVAEVEPNFREIAKVLWVDEFSVPEGKNRNHILSAVREV